MLRIHPRHGRASSDGAVGKCPDCAKYYAVLGLSGNATEAEVKQAYKDLVKSWHPDRFSENDERLRCKADERLKEINGAYSHISKHWEPSRSEEAAPPPGGSPATIVICVRRLLP